MSAIRRSICADPTPRTLLHTVGFRNRTRASDSVGRGHCPPSPRLGYSLDGASVPGRREGLDRGPRASRAQQPALCTSPQQLASANVVRGMLDSLAALGGPLLAALLLETSGLSSVFVVCAAASLVSGLVVLALPYDVPPRGPRPARTGARAVLQGFSAITAGRGLLLITRLGA